MKMPVIEINNAPDEFNRFTCILPPEEGLTTKDLDFKFLDLGDALHLAMETALRRKLDIVLRWDHTRAPVGQLTIQIQHQNILWRPQ